MKLELALVAWAVALAFAQMLIAASAATLHVGLPMLAGNRDDMPPRTGWAGRAQRAHLNMPVVAGKTNAMTALGAQLFFWARLAYALVYLAGVPWARTGVWLVSIIGLILIFAQLL